MNSHRNRKRNQNKSGSPRSLDQSRMLDALQQIVRLNEAETNRMVPSTADIPRLKLKKDRVFSASFSYAGPSITTNSTTETSGAIAFALNNVPGYTSWTGSFDSYRIIAAYVEFVPFINQTTANNTLGQIATAIDYDDATAVTQMALFQYDTSMLVESGRFFERRVVPRAAKALYSGSAFTSYGQDTAPWIDTSSPGVQHYGVKYSQSVSSSANTPYSTLVTLVVNFRNSA